MAQGWSEDWRAAWCSGSGVEVPVEAARAYRGEVPGPRFISIACPTCGVSRVAKVLPGEVSAPMPEHRGERQEGETHDVQRSPTVGRRGCTAPEELGEQDPGEVSALAVVVPSPAVATVAPQLGRGDQNPALVYLASLSGRGAGEGRGGRRREGASRATMRASLELLLAVLGSPLSVETFPWSELRYQHAATLRARLLGWISPRTSRPLSPATVNKALAALRGVAREAWRLGLLSAEEHARTADINGVRGSRLPAGRAVPMADQELLFAALSSATAAGARDAAILAVGFAGGLRREEIAGLDVASWDAVEGELRVLGKGNKERAVPMANGGRAALEAWLARRGRSAGPLFVKVDKRDQIIMRRLSVDAVGFLVERAGERAGVRLTPHDLRRSYVTSLLDAGVDLGTAQKLAGHANIATTARYDRRGRDAGRNAAARLTTPYKRP